MDAQALQQVAVGMPRVESRIDGNRGPETATRHRGHDRVVVVSVRVAKVNRGPAQFLFDPRLGTRDLFLDQLLIERLELRQWFGSYRISRVDG